VPGRPPAVEPEIVRGDLTEAQLAAHLTQPELAVDTETLGLNLLRDRLCVVQMCDSAGRATLVQVPAAAPPEPGAPSPAPRLKRLLEAPGILKVFHFARFDVATLRRYLGIEVSPLYCTRTASKLVRTYTDRHGLKDVALELLDVEMEKATRHSDWGVAELSREQVRYAISDVTLLLDIKQRLDVMLAREGRAQLARDCFAAIPLMARLDLQGFDLLFEH
jgi:ribonuclease D